VSLSPALSNLALHEIAALAEYIRRLRQKWPERIAHVWLFGSKARGDGGPESEIDLLIVAADDGQDIDRNISRLTVEVDLAYGVVLSDHVVGIERFRQMAAWEEPIYHSIQRDGIDLWSMELQPTT
jgi:predicted nucleotidyltransferase